MVPPQKKTYLFACFFGICTYVMKKKTLRKQKNNIPGLLQKQKSKKPQENQKKQKKQYSRTLAKVKMQKPKKPREIQNCFFGFLKVFWIFAFLLLQESWNIVFFVFLFFWFSRGFLDFCFCKSPGIFFFVFCCFLKVF